MVGKLLQRIRKTENIKRYNTERMLFPRSVGEHTAGVCQIGFVLAQWEEFKFGHAVNWRELLGRHLFHDSHEPNTGDMRPDMKNYSATMSAEVKRAENGIFDRVFRAITPESWREDMKRFMLHAKDETLEGRIMKASDLLDRIFEMQTELSYVLHGSQREEFLMILQGDLSELLHIDLDSLRYFLKYPLQDLGLQAFYPEGFEVEIQRISFNDSHFQNVMSIHTQGGNSHAICHQNA